MKTSTGILFLCGIAGLWGCSREQPSAPQTPLAGSNAADRAQAANPAFSKLIGQWVRPDGGYVLEIKAVDPAGKLTAAYLNPRVINVSRAQAIWEQTETVKVFVELRDEGYPGSTYALVYDTRSDQLSGSYYQAASGETYEVFFIRNPQP